MVLEIIMWGFFSYWGWQLGDYVKDRVVEKPVIEQAQDNKEKSGKN